MKCQSDRELLKNVLEVLEMEAKGYADRHHRLMPIIWAITEHLKQTPMIVSTECAERGCMAHDDRVDGQGVAVNQPAARQSL